MPVCVLCKFDVAEDDVKLRRNQERVVCLACYAREVDDERRMGKDLRRQITEAMGTGA